MNSGFFIGLIFRLILGVRQVRLFGTWVRLELNMLIFVAAIRGAKVRLETVSIKYFIIQRIGSRVFLSGVVLGALQASHSLLSIFVGFSLILKLGVAPLHGWFVRVLSQLS